ncbi:MULTISPECIES: DNA-binding protein [Shewanella]|uniref:DNA-binding protein n=1 Tax=Shewanella TaxID=22 RepID=UPI00048D926C|nr:MULTISPECIES: DNA-binding protein [Shewanella]QLE86851.1 DNA-binding protein [Shewanella sp. Scap07]
MAESTLNLEQVAELLGKSPATIKRFARESLLTNIGDEDAPLFNEAEVQRYLAFQNKLG